MDCVRSVGIRSEFAKIIIFATWILLVDKNTQAKFIMETLKGEAKMHFEGLPSHLNYSGVWAGCLNNLGIGNQNSKFSQRIYMI